MLPPETWAQILELAVAVPDPPVVPQRVHNGVSYDLCPRALARHRDSLMVKRRIARACRQWNALSIGLLYEHITLDSDYQLTLLLRVVRDSPTIRNADDARAFGDLVKRLDIIIDRPPIKRFSTMAPVPEELTEPLAAQLVSLLPNLVTLIWTCEPSSAFPFSSITTAPRLKYLGLYGRAQCRAVSGPQLLQFFESHPHLVHLDLPTCHLPPDTDKETPRKVRETTTYPAIHRLYVNDDRCLEILRRSTHFPNLQEMLFHSKIDRPIPRKFLRRVLHNLTTIHIGGSNTHQVPYSLATIAKCCRKVQDLVLFSPCIDLNGYVRGVKRRAPVLSPLSGITTLRVHTILWPGSSSDAARLYQSRECGPLLESITKWIVYLPNLKSVVLE